MNRPDYDFDEDIDRRAVPSLKTHEMVLGKDGGHLFAAGVADMDYPVAPDIIKALQARLDHRVFGYEATPERLMQSIQNWMQERHGWRIDGTHILRAPDVLNSLAKAIGQKQPPA